MGAGRGQQRRVNVALRLSRAGISQDDLHKITHDNPYARVIQALTDFLAKRGYKIKLIPANNKKHGSVCFSTKVVKLVDNLNHVERTYVLLHEAAHVMTNKKNMLGEDYESYKARKVHPPSFKERSKRCRAKEEIIAETVALTISKALRIDPSQDLQKVDPHLGLGNNIDKLDNTTPEEIVDCISGQIHSIEKQLMNILLAKIGKPKLVTA